MNPDTKPTTPADDDHSHYDWGASVAKTWRGCPGSINYSILKRDEGSIPADTSTSYSREGTEAHNYADRCLKGEIKRTDIPEEFHEHLEGYLDFATEIALENGGEVFFEQQVLLFYNPEKTGTLDYAVVSNDRVDILDLKYGVGVGVDVEENDQLAIYALSLIISLNALGEFTITDQTPVHMHIYQPRHRDFDGLPKTWIATYRELLDMAIDIKTDYERSKFSDPDHRVPSKDACQFCDARRVCDKRIIALFEDIPDNVIPFGDTEPDVAKARTLEINDQTRLAIFKFGKEITKFFEDTNEDTLALIEQGRHIEGLKSVDGGPGNRSWGSNEEEAEKLLRKIPVEERYKPRRVISPAQTEKVLKKLGTPLEAMSTRFKNRFTELIQRKEGGPKLALASDKKPARTTGTKMFDEEVAVDDCF